MGNIYNSPYYTIWNYYYYPYRMPNCTAYSFGRFNELAQVTGLNSRWPTGNGCDWYRQAPGKGLQTGQTPQLGAAACWWYLDSQGRESGHCGIVEELITSGGIVTGFRTSNSAYYRVDPDDPNSDAGVPVEAFPYFYLETVSMNNLDYRQNHPEAYFQGFVYHPDIHPTPVIGIPEIIAGIAGAGNKTKIIKRIRRWKP